MKKKTKAEMAEMAAAAAGTFARTRKVGKETARRAVEVADAVLVEAGKAAKRRQRRRATKAALKAAGKAAIAAGTLVAAAIAVNSVRAKKAAS